MSFELWLSFVVTASIILVIPGPTIIYVVGQSLTHGKKASLPLALGVVSGDAVCIVLSLLGLSILLSIFSMALLVVKYLGASYLVFLGITMIRTRAKANAQHLPIASYHAKSIFRDVFLVNALNPKGIVFYSAFMPQFVDPQHDIIFQFGLLSLTFLVLALINVVAYSMLASKSIALFKSSRLTNAFHLSGGVCLICAGVYSAAVKRH